jgi:hypothetical protein
MLAPAAADYQDLHRISLVSYHHRRASPNSGKAVGLQP